jgi:NAD(P)-dependent dehydrogenase (short-subunit alcohol dehydrogenase family)
MRALVIGNSDGIGLKVTEKLLALNWVVTGVSRRQSPIRHDSYTHLVLDVAATEFANEIQRLVNDDSALDVCIYCAGIGTEFDACDIQRDIHVFEVNLIGALVAAKVVIPSMIKKGWGHFIVLSSLADQLLMGHTPSYQASKAAMSSYFESAGLILRAQGIKVTNIRFGFVDTKMAVSPVKPFMITPDKAADVVVGAIGSPAIRISYPRIVAVLVALVSAIQRLRVALVGLSRSYSRKSAV